MERIYDYCIIGSVNCLLLSVAITLFGVMISPVLAGDIRESSTIGKEVKISASTEVMKEVNMTEQDMLSEQEGKYLLSVARGTIEDRLFEAKKDKPIEPELSGKVSEKRGTFVTLTMDNNLRGCIGHIVPQETVMEGIKVNAINAAFKDPRFQPLSREEWGAVKIEISILTEPKPLEYSDADDLLNKLRPDIDGVIIKKGLYQSTFLPQVWEQLPDKKEFLMHLCLKAGLDGHAWQSDTLEVLTYQAQAFEEE